MLTGRYSEIVANYHDEHYRERNVGRLMQMLVSHAGIDGKKLCRFIEQRKSEGICGVTEMLLTDESLFALADKTDMASAMTFFTDPAIYREFSPEAKKRTAGIKIFTDGSLGARTAALSTPYLCGRPMKSSRRSFRRSRHGASVLRSTPLAILPRRRLPVSWQEWLVGVLSWSNQGWNTPN